MATYFWVGGTGNWSSTAHWAASSGGAGGSGPPTSADTAMFDGNSGSGTSTMDLTTSQNCAELSLATSAITVSLSQPFNLNTLLHTQGTFTTNGQTVTVQGAWLCNGSLARTINLGASSITVGSNLNISGNSSVLDFSGSGLTLNAGTSSIELEATSTTSVNQAWQSQPNLTYYNVTICPGGTPSSTAAFGDYDCAIDQSTFNNLTILGTNAAFTQMAITGTVGITVNGTLTVTGFSRQTLVGMRSGVNYLTCTINTPNPPSLTNCNFFDIVAQGAGTPWTGTTVSDGQGNTNIVGDASRTLYWVGNSGTWGDAGGAHWSTSSGGSPGAPCPLAQDDVHIDANSITTTAQTINASASRWLCRDLIMTGVAQAFTFTTPGVASAPSTWATFGNITLNSNCTFTDADTFEWSFRDQRNTTGASPSPYGTITCNGCTIVNETRVSVSSINNVIQLGGPGLFGAKLTGNGGMFDTAGYPLSVSSIIISAGTAAGFNFRSSAITLTGTSAINANAGTWLGLNTASYTVTAPNPQLQLAGYAYGPMSFTSTGNVTIGNDQIVNWNPVGSTVASLSFTGPASQFGNCTFCCPINVTGLFQVSGSSAINRYFLQTVVAGQAAPISAGSVGLTNVDFMDIQATLPGGGNWTGTSMGDCQGNSGITFDASISTTWSGAVNANTSWTAATTNWSSGRIPLPQDDVAVSGAWGSNLLFTLNAPRLCRNLDFSGMTGGKIQLSNSSINGLGNSVYGSLKLNSIMVGAARGASLSTSAPLIFGDRRGGSTINWATVQPSTTSLIEFSAPGGGYTFNDALTTTRPITHQAGTLALNNLSHSIKAMTISGQQPRTLAVGSGTLTLTGTGTVWVGGSGSSTAANLTVTGTGIVDITDATAAKTFQGASQTYTFTLRYQAASVQGLTITGSNTFGSLILKTTTARTDTVTALSTQAILPNGALTIQGAASNLLTLAIGAGPAWLRISEGVTVSTGSNTSIPAAVAVTSAGIPPLQL